MEIRTFDLLAFATAILMSLTSEGDQARQAQAVGQYNELHGLQTGTWSQKSTVQELKHSTHTGCTGVWDGHLASQKKGDILKKKKKKSINVPYICETHLINLKPFVYLERGKTEGI